MGLSTKPSINEWYGMQCPWNKNSKLRSCELVDKNRRVPPKGQHWDAEETSDYLPRSSRVSNLKRLSLDERPAL